MVLDPISDAQTKPGSVWMQQIPRKFMGCPITPSCIDFRKSNFGFCYDEDQIEVPIFLLESVLRRGKQFGTRFHFSEEPRDRSAE